MAEKIWQKIEGIQQRQLMQQEDLNELLRRQDATYRVLQHLVRLIKEDKE